MQTTTYKKRIRGDKMTNTRKKITPEGVAEMKEERKRIYLTIINDEK